MSDELSKHLQEQLGFLDASCALYDAGSLNEAKRLATSIRVLVHDTTQSASVLTQLGAKENLKYLDGSGPGFDGLDPVGPNAITSIATLTQLAHFDDHVEYHPAFVLSTPASKTVDFDPWWKTLVTHDVDGRRMSRRRLVLVMANQDGGAHVDQNLAADYKEISSDSSMGWKANGGSVEFYKDPHASVDAPSPAPASVRHLAEELSITLRQFIPHLLGELAKIRPQAPYAAPVFYTGGQQFSWGG